MKQVICDACGKQMDEDAVFCSACGKKRASGPDTCVDCGCALVRGRLYAANRPVLFWPEHSERLFASSAVLCDTCPVCGRVYNLRLKTPRDIAP